MKLTLRSCLLVAAMVAVLPCLASAQVTRWEHKPEETILWKDSQQEHALFIPASLLRTIDLAPLPISTEEFRTLERVIDSSIGQSFQEQRREKFLEHVATRKQQPDFLGLAQATTFTFIGRVTHRITGWSVWSGGVAKAIYVEVEEVLHDLNQVLTPGDVLVYFEFGGEAIILQVPVWTPLEAEGLDFALPGRAVLIHGDFYGENRRVVLPFGRFPIVKGRAYAYKDYTLEEPASVSVGGLRQSLASIDKEVRR